MLGDYDLEGLGDLNQYDSVEELLDTGLYTQGAQILWDFYKSIQIGDYVAAYAKNHIIGIGTVTSGYQYGSYNKYGSSG